MKKWLLVPAVFLTLSLPFLIGSGSAESSIAASADLGVVFNFSHDCSSCHGLHGGSSDQLLNNQNVEALCLSCHGPTGPSVLKADVHIYTNSTCQDCHDPHSNPTNWLGGTNIKLVLDSVVDPLNGIKRPVVFESADPAGADPSLHSFCDGDEDGNTVWDGVCDTCHTTLRRHNYDATGSHSHQQAKTCTRSGCHVHVTGFVR